MARRTLVLLSRIDGKNAGVEFESFDGVIRDQSGADGVLVVEDVRAVELHAVGDEVVVDRAGDALKNQIAGLVGIERDLAVAGEPGELKRDLVVGLLIRQRRCNTPARSDFR